MKLSKFLYILGQLLVTDTIIYGLMSLLFIDDIYKFVIMIGVSLIIVGKELGYEDNNKRKPDNEEEPFTDNKSR